MLLDKITPFKSVGDIWLGVNEDDAKRVLGDDFVRTLDDDGSVELDYSALGLRLQFWHDCDFRLGTIGVERPTASLLGHLLFGQSKEQIGLFVRDQLNASVSEANGCAHADGSVQEWMDVDAHGLSFWFDNNALYLIDVFCDSTDGDEWIWPFRLS